MAVAWPYIKNKYNENLYFTSMNQDKKENEINSDKKNDLDEIESLLKNVYSETIDKTLKREVIKIFYKNENNNDE